MTRAWVRMVVADSKATRALTTFLAGLSLLIPAWIGLDAPVPTVVHPMPILTVVPAFSLFRAAALVPTLLFFLWYPGLFRGEAHVPKRSYGMFVALSGLSVVWFVADWHFASKYHGAQYTYFVCALNVLWLGLLWVLFILKRAVSRGHRRADQ